MAGAASVAELITIPPDWQASLEHLADNLNFRLGAITDRLNQLDQKITGPAGLEQRVSGLEVLELNRPAPA